jgi:hypothetical protein
MAASFRNPNNKATKIFYKVMGIPNNLRFSKPIMKKSIRNRLRNEVAFTR